MAEGMAESDRRLGQRYLGLALAVRELRVDLALPPRDPV